MRLTVFSLAVLVAIVNAYTSMTDMPGFIAMRACAQWPLSFGVRYDMQCDNDICFCNRFPEAITRLINSVSTSSCSGTDIESATSILSAFCEQVPSLTYHFNAPVATGVVATSAAGNGVGQTTTVVTPAAPASSVVLTTATTTFITTDSKGQTSVVTSFVVTAHNTPAFKSAANYYGAVSGVFMTAIAVGICAFITLLWV